MLNIFRIISIYITWFFFQNICYWSLIKNKTILILNFYFIHLHVHFVCKKKHMRPWRAPERWVNDLTYTGSQFWNEPVSCSLLSDSCGVVPKFTLKLARFGSAWYLLKFMRHLPAVFFRVTSGLETKLTDYFLFSFPQPIILSSAFSKLLLNTICKKFFFICFQ